MSDPHHKAHSAVRIARDLVRVGSGDVHLITLGFSAAQAATIRARWCEETERMVIVLGPAGAGLSTSACELARLNLLDEMSPDHGASGRDRAGAMIFEIGCDADAHSAREAITTAIEFSSRGTRAVVIVNDLDVPSLIERITNIVQASDVRRFLYRRRGSLIDRTISFIVNQRLIPILCQECAIPCAHTIFGNRRGSLFWHRPQGAAEAAVLRGLAELGALDAVKLQGNGCSFCQMTGIERRVLLAEVLLPEQINAIALGRDTQHPSIERRVVDLILSGQADPMIAGLQIL